MKRREFIAFLCGGTAWPLMAPLAAQAQQPVELSGTAAQAVGVVVTPD